ncbi:hypothetical protein [Reyranella sp.]|uniref:hypothetical protein n=1 Tax=Reyranella sp. TaxID=1929291 RepID=UPI003BAAAA2D
MGPIQLKVEQLVLDNDNPRITHSESQQQTLQKVVRDQKTKLVRLAQSIVEKGLSPIERLAVMQVTESPKRYIALEGNRRVAALKLLTNPAVMTGLEMPNGMQKTLERLAKVFDRSKVASIDCYEVGAREDARYWIELRHNGEDQGRGVVSWKPIVAARYRKRSPAIQAFDVVIEHGGFSEEEAEQLRQEFPLSTFQRFMESPEVRDLIGLKVREGQVRSDLPPAEFIKPLKKIVRDLADKRGSNSRRFNSTTQMVDYVKGFAKSDKPDLSKKVPERPIEGVQGSEFAKAARARTRVKRSSDPSMRTTAVPKGCPVNVKDNRIGGIYGELQRLRLEDAPNAIAVLLRVFLEMSVDHFLENNGGSVEETRPDGKKRFKELDKKLAEVVAMLVSEGVPRAHFESVIRSVSVKTSPMYIGLFHRYVHDRFATPSPQDLRAAWEHAQPLFEKIWP